MTAHLRTLLAFTALGLTTSGCAGFGKAVGGGKNPPDEFAIATKAPLTLPPDYALRPPKPGETRPQEKSTSERTKQLLIGDESKEPPTQGELALIQSAGALEVDSNIRAILAAENGGRSDKATDFANRIIFWRTGADGKLITEDAPLKVDDPEEWLKSRQESINKVTGEGQAVTISKKKERILNLPGVK